MSSTSSPRPIQYLSLTETAKLVTANPPRDDYLVIDVRTSDFPGGNLPRALNLPSRLFDSPTSTRSCITTHILPRLSQGLKLVIVHCMRSQWRGPTVAQRLGECEVWPRSVEVRVMEGGYAGWRRRFQGQEEGMFENLPSEGVDSNKGRHKIEGKVVSAEQAAREGWVDVEDGDDGEGMVEEMHSVELREAAERRAKGEQGR